eukprot:1160185-Pelagomonas_calceolata.AAC.11
MAGVRAEGWGCALGPCMERGGRCAWFSGFLGMGRLRVTLRCVTAHLPTIMVTFSASVSIGNGRVPTHTHPLFSPVAVAACRAAVLAVAAQVLEGRDLGAGTGIGSSKDGALAVCWAHMSRCWASCGSDKEGNTEYEQGREGHPCVHMRSGERVHPRAPSLQATVSTCMI